MGRCLAVGLDAEHALCGHPLREALLAYLEQPRVISRDLAWHPLRKALLAEAVRAVGEDRRAMRADHLVADRARRRRRLASRRRSLLSHKYSFTH